MNYLAHLFLSPNNHKVMVGNLMGDFIKGQQQQLLKLEPSIQQGVLLHRAIDKFTDNHSDVKQLKSLLSAKRKRFAGIISDVVFDHLLAANWQQYSQSSLPDFAKHCYQILEQHHQQMPIKMQHMVNRMIVGNWLVAYQETTSISGALNGISKRIRFENQLEGAYQEVLPNLSEYQQVFQRFFPELQRHVTCLSEHL